MGSTPASARPHGRRLRAALITPAAALLGLALAALPAEGAMFRVDSTADGPDKVPGDGRCQTSIGTCPLRAAVQEADALRGPDEITLPGGTWPLRRGELTLGRFAGRLEARRAGVTTIRGPGLRPAGLGAAPGATISAFGRSRVFRTLPGSTLVLEGLTIRGGRVRAGSGGREDAAGGAILAGGPLTLRDVEIAHSRSEGHGGAVRAEAGVLRERVVLRANTAYAGGALSAPAGSRLEDVTVKDNVATAYTGGVELFLGPGDNRAVLERVAILANRQLGRGPGGASGSGLSARGNVTIRNSTIADNVTEGTPAGTVASDLELIGLGGGLFEHLTIRSRQGLPQSEAVELDSVGFPAGRSPYAMGDSIIDSDVCLVTGSLGGNVVRRSCFTIQGQGDIAADPLLGPIRPGLLTTPPYIDPLPGSPALGRALGCRGFDQRGRFRPASACDSGAVEVS